MRLFPDLPGHNGNLFPLRWSIRHRFTSRDTRTLNQLMRPLAFRSGRHFFLALVMLTILVIAPIGTSHGQVSYDGNGAATSNLINVDTVSIPAFAVPGGIERLLLVSVDYSSPATAVTSVTYDGVNLSHAVTSDRDGVVFVDIWYLALGDGIAMAGDVDVLLNGLTNNTRAGAASFQTVDQLEPLGSSWVFSDVFQTGSALLVNSVPDNGIADAAMVVGYPGLAPVAGASQTEVFNILQANFLVGSYQLALGGPANMDWSFDQSTHVVHAAIELRCSCNQPIVNPPFTLGDDVLQGGNGNDILFGDAGNDLIMGQWGDDHLAGGEGNDVLYGGFGDDVIVPGPGDNCIHGGEKPPETGTQQTPNGLVPPPEILDQPFEIDTVNMGGFAGAMGVVSYGGGGGGGGGLGGLGAAGLAALVAATARTDPVEPPTPEMIECGLVVPQDPDHFTTSTHGIEVFIGTSFNDTFLGAEDIDTFIGGAGNDEMIGGLGDDHLDGGAGEDTVSYANAPSAVVVDLGAGTATGGENNDKLANFEIVKGSQFNDKLKTGSKGAKLYGELGDDSLDGGAGNDKLYGGQGKDTFNPGLGDDELFGGIGVDLYELAIAAQTEPDHVKIQVQALTSGIHQIVSKIAGGIARTQIQNPPQGNTNFTDTLHDIEKIRGTAFDDTFAGAEGSDIFDGAGGEDLLEGGAGGDFLEGGPGDDELRGGEGGDSYILALEDLAGHDQISDVEGKDKLSFVDFGLDQVVSASQGAAGSLELVFLGGGSLVVEQHFSNRAFALERLEVGGCSYRISTDPGFTSGSIQEIIGDCIIFDSGFEE